MTLIFRIAGVGLIPGRERVGDLASRKLARQRLAREQQPIAAHRQHIGSTDQSTADSRWNERLARASRQQQTTEGGHGKKKHEFIYDRPYLYELAEAVREAVKSRQPAKANVLAQKVVEVAKAELRRRGVVRPVISRVGSDGSAGPTSLARAPVLQARLNEDEETAAAILMLS